MRQHALLPSLAALAVAAVVMGTAPAARAEVYMYFRADVPSTPLSLTLTNAPPVVLIPGTSVYYVEDGPYDIYRYGGFYYVYDDGYWYRSRRMRGPFIGVAAVYVPRPVVYVPVRYRPHWVVVTPEHRVRAAGFGPPGHAGHPGRGNGHGRGHWR